MSSVEELGYCKPPDRPEKKEIEYILRKIGFNWAFSHLHKTADQILALFPDKPPGEQDLLLVEEDIENKLVELLCQRNGWDFPSGNADCADYDMAVRDVKWFIKNYTQIAKPLIRKDEREKVFKEIERDIIYIALEMDGTLNLHLQTNSVRSAEKYQALKGSSHLGSCPD